jgi:hypothetical protein
MVDVTTGTYQGHPYRIERYYEMINLGEGDFLQEFTRFIAYVDGKELDLRKPAFRVSARDGSDIEDGVRRYIDYLESKKPAGD